MFKKLTAFLLTAAMLFTVVSISVSADSQVSVRTAVSGGAYSGRERLARQENGDVLVRVYDNLASGLSSCSNNIDIQGTNNVVNYSQLTAVMNACLADHPEIFWFKGSYYRFGTEEKVFYIIPKYTTGGTDMENKGAAIKAASKVYLAGIDDNMSEYDRAKVIHDRLVAGIQYDISAANGANIYGALVEGRALCEGYAKAYQYLLRKAGIEAEFVTGSAGGISHAWLLVKIDGEYYYNDITWDDPLEGDESGNPVDSYPLHVINYCYFNVTAETLKKTHTINNESDFPVCTATTANYYTKNDFVLTEFNTDTIAALLMKNGGYARIYAGTDALSESFADSFMNNASEIARKAGASGTLAVGITGTAREFIPYIITSGTSVLTGSVFCGEGGSYTVSLTKKGASTPFETVVCKGEYAFTGIESGEYTLRAVSESGCYSTCEITAGNADIESCDMFITRYGDINFDGNVDLTDLLRLKLVIAGSADKYNADGFSLTSENLPQKLVELQKMLLEP